MTADLKGVPAISVMTTAFVDAAELMARVHGVPDHPFAVIQHPISNANDELLADKAETAVAEAVRVLTGV